MIVAVIDPANTPHGYNWTFAFPMLLFIVIAAILYALFSRPHHRVPARRISAIGVGSAAGSGPAQATAAASSVTAAPGGGAGETAAESADESTDEPATPAADTGEGSEASE